MNRSRFRSFITRLPFRWFTGTVAPHQRWCTRLNLERCEDRTMLTVVAPGTTWLSADGSVSVTNNAIPYADPIEVNGGGGAATIYGLGSGGPGPAGGPTHDGGGRYQIAVTGHGSGAGNATWLGNADYLEMGATGSINSIDITGDLILRSGFSTIGTLHGNYVAADAHGSIGPITGNNVGNVTAGQDIGNIRSYGSAGAINAQGNIGTVTANGSINLIWAREQLGAVTAGGSIGTVTASALTAPVTAGGPINGVAAFGHPSGFDFIYDGHISGAITAGGGINIVTTRGHITAPIRANGGWIGQMIVTGNMTADLFAAGDISRVDIGGDLTGAVYAGGAIDTIQLGNQHWWYPVPPVSGTGTFSGSLQAGGGLQRLQTKGGLNASVTTGAGIDHHHWRRGGLRHRGRRQDQVAQRRRRFHWLCTSDRRR